MDACRANSGTRFIDSPVLTIAGNAKVFGDTTQNYSANASWGAGLAAQVAHHAARASEDAERAATPAHRRPADY